MSITAKILLDSITDGGSRLVTWELTFGRLFLCELLTHGALARNSASSRAMSMSKLREAVEAEPFMHHSWGKNERGMQASSEIDDTDAAKDWWIRGRNLMAAHHFEGERLGLHKQIVNRVIEPWMHVTVILSATDHANFFHLRNHDKAEPSFHELARQMSLYHSHMPRYRAPGEWHLPLVNLDDRVDDEHAFQQPGHDPMWLQKIATGRCARVSYLTHHNRRERLEDIALAERLATDGHWSPFEHVAVATGGRERHAKFEGWKSYRRLFPQEAGPDTSDRCERCGCWAGNHVTSCPDKEQA